jgi:hypothetical protein
MKKMLTTALLYLFLGEHGWLPEFWWLTLVYRRSWIPLSFLNYGRGLGKSRLHTAFESMLGIKMRYIGVIWFHFSCSPTSTHRFLHNQNSCCISESAMKHLQKTKLKFLTSANKSYGYWNCMCVASWMDRHVLRIVSSVQCRVVISIWRSSLTSFQRASLWCLLFDPHWTTYRPSIGVWLRKRAT